MNFAPFSARFDQADGRRPLGDVAKDEVRELLKLLYKNKLLIAAIFVWLSTLATIAIYSLPKKYTAESVVVIETRKNKLSDLQSILSTLTLESGAVRTEVDLIQLPSLAQRVIEKLDLLSNPEFVYLRPGARSGRLAAIEAWLGSLVPAGLHARLEGVWSDIESLWSKVTFAPPAMQTPKVADEYEMRAIGYFLENLDILNEPRTYTIRVRYTSSDRTLSADIANAVAEQYIVEQLDTRFEALRQTNSWLSERLSDLRQKLADSENAVESYREQHDLGKKGAVSPAQQELSELNSQLIIATAELAQAEARYREAQRGSTAANKTYEASASEVLASPLIQQLREQEATLRSREAELSMIYQNRHPSVVNVHAQIADLDKKINEEIQRILHGLQGNMQVAQARVNNLRQQMQRVNDQVSQDSQAEVHLRALERDAEANKALYENLLQRFKETTAQSDFQQPDARVVSRANVPILWSFPRQNVLLSISLLAAAVISIGTALLVERLRAGITSLDQGETLFGIRGLGIATLVRHGLGRATKPSELPFEQPRSAYSENLRTIRTGILQINRMKPPKVVLVTSSFKGDGKTTLATSLAHSAALSGQACLLIDADLRRPHAHVALDAQPHPGLRDVVAESIPLRDAIQVHPDTGLHFLASGGVVDEPLTVLSQKYLRKLISELSTSYDLILIDTPPLMAVTDALHLSPVTDLLILAIRWKRTPRDVVLKVLKLLHEPNQPPISFVLTHADSKRLDYYELGSAYNAAYGATARRAAKRPARRVA